jgi:hypothetical protein
VSRSAVPATFAFATANFGPQRTTVAQRFTDAGLARRLLDLGHHSGGDVLLRNLLLPACLLLALSPRAEAIPIVGTSAEGSGGVPIFGFTLCVPCSPLNLILGQEFVIGSQPVIVDAVTLFVTTQVSAAAGETFLLQVMDLIGPAATPANVLHSAVGAFPDVNFAGLPVHFGDFDLTLRADTSYFLVVSTSAGSSDTFGFLHGWKANGSKIEPFGTVGPRYLGRESGGGIADYNDLQPNAGAHVNFLVEGRPADPIPEPATGVLFLLAGAGAAIIRARSRSAQ